MIRLFALLFLFASPLAAEQVVMGVSRNEVAITATFEGDEVLIFGAVKRDAPSNATNPLQVIVTLSGPDQPVTVRRKSRQFGIWVNTDAVEVGAAPSFYAVATSDVMGEVISDFEDLRADITISRAINAVDWPASIDDPTAFVRALIRIRERQGLYKTLEGAVELEQETLFNTSISMPANLIEGEYSARIFLTRGGSIIDTYETPITVRKVGLERWLYNLAHENAILYGLMSLAIAIAAGWGASAVFQAFRR
jgi:uncharacterized protein (TIGR02186 family)